MTATQPSNNPPLDLDNLIKSLNVSSKLYLEIEKHIERESDMRAVREQHMKFVHPSAEVLQKINQDLNVIVKERAKATNVYFASRQSASGALAAILSSLTPSTNTDISRSYAEDFSKLQREFSEERQLRLKRQERQERDDETLRKLEEDSVELKRKVHSLQKDHETLRNDSHEALAQCKKFKRVEDELPRVTGTVDDLQKKLERTTQELQSRWKSLEETIGERTRDDMIEVHKIKASSEVLEKNVQKLEEQRLEESAKLNEEMKDILKKTEEMIRQGGENSANEFTNIEEHNNLKRNLESFKVYAKDIIRLWAEAGLEQNQKIAELQTKVDGLAESAMPVKAQETVEDLASKGQKRLRDDLETQIEQQGKRLKTYEDIVEGHRIKFSQHKEVINDHGKNMRDFQKFTRFIEKEVNVLKSYHGDNIKHSSATVTPQDCGISVPPGSVDSTPGPDEGFYLKEPWAERINQLEMRMQSIEQRTNLLPPPPVTPTGTHLPSPPAVGATAIQQPFVKFTLDDAYRMANQY